MQVDELRQARAMAEETARLKRIVADLSLQIDILRPVGCRSPLQFEKQAAHN